MMTILLMRRRLVPATVSDAFESLFCVFAVVCEEVWSLFFLFACCAIIRSCASVDTDADINGMELDDRKSSSREKSLEPVEEAEEPEPQPEPQPKSHNVPIVQPKSAVDRRLEELEARLPPIRKGALRRWQEQNALEVCN